MDKSDHKFEFANVTLMQYFNIASNVGLASVCSKNNLFRLWLVTHVNHQNCIYLQRMHLQSNAILAEQLS